MPVNVRVDGGVVVLSNFGRLMNDPRHFDASRDVRELIDQGYRQFALELRAVGEMGASGLGLLMTITRLVRQHDGEVVLVGVTRALERQIEDMQMEDYWETFGNIEQAKSRFAKGDGD